ncbi:hypothetical protein [Cerasicoccus frondis]|uniref:hypothetical protein n=1 Tax=Cerasicoccus frondis TaxID=490090 RepID=UPI00285260D4|nr:hypothetical protein [Cerasicoccus frondis]
MSDKQTKKPESKQPDLEIFHERLRIGVMWEHKAGFSVRLNYIPIIDVDGRLSYRSLTEDEGNLVAFIPKA